MGKIRLLRCVSCGREYLPGEVQYTCTDCGDLLGTLDVVYDYESIKRKFSKDILNENRDFSLWRYLPILPVEKTEYIQPLHTGWTPLTRFFQLETTFGLRRLHIKDDTRNPTGSLKDRASSIAIARALEGGHKVVTAASSGNAGCSMAAFAACAGIKSYIFVPDTIPRAKLAQLVIFGANVILVKGTYDQSFELCLDASKRWGWYSRNTAYNPYLVEGKKTVALEICEQLNWKIPDKIFVPVGDGCIISGVWKGFCDMHKLGFIDGLPSLVGVQAKGSAPLVEAFEEGRSSVEPIIPHTIADSIKVGNPRDQVKALRAIRESSGTFISVSDKEIKDAINLLATSTGIFAEPAGATALAGLKKAVGERLVDPNERIVILVTGTGLKDIEAVDFDIETKTISVEPSIEDVERKLGIFRERERP